MNTTNIFRINGSPIVTPDAGGVRVSFSNITAGSSGRDEAGYFRPEFVRYNVGEWKFTYSGVTEEERAYMESLFVNEPFFEFSYPDRLDSSKTVFTYARRTKTSITWYDAAIGLWKNYGFTIEEL